MTVSDEAKCETIVKTFLVLAISIAISMIFAGKIVYTYGLIGRSFEQFLSRLPFLEKKNYAS